MTTAVPLQFDQFGEQGPALLILHGLLGSGRNWRGLAKQLARRRRVIVPDLRNHGASPQHPQMDYPPMATDILSLLDRLEIPALDVIGHSMGGKLAMWLALRRPGVVKRLLVVDIAPVGYGLHHAETLEAMQALPLASLAGRGEAEALLAKSIPEPGLRQFLLQNLLVTDEGLDWRVDLEILRQNLGRIAAFAATTELSPYSGPSLFLAGEHSDYVLPEHHPTIRTHFPAARIQTVAAAGHWLHVEQPAAFLREAETFLAPP